MGVQAKNTYYGLQALRALAAIMVVVFHTGSMLFLRFDTDISSWTAFGAGGVDIFFVVSGFIMTYTTNKDFSAYQFLIRRIIRLVPLYWAATISCATLAFVGIPLVLLDTTLILKDYVCGFLFLPNYNTYLRISPPVGPGWTLVYEMFFYVAIAIASKFYFARRLIVLGVVFAALVLVGAMHASRNALYVTYTDPISLEFLLGCVVAELGIRSYLPLTRRAAMALTVIGAICLVSGTVFAQFPAFRVVYWGIPAFLIVLGISRLEKQVNFRQMRVVQAIGDSSYSLYLLHAFALSGLALLLSRFVHWNGGLFVVPIAVLVCCVLGWFCHMLVEKPVTEFLKQRLTPRRVSAGPERIKVSARELARR